MCFVLLPLANPYAQAIRTIVAETSLTVHRYEEFFVRFGIFHSSLYQIHCFLRVHVSNVIAEYQHAIPNDFVKQQIVPSGGGQYEVDCWVNAFVREFSV